MNSPDSPETLQTFVPNMLFPAQPPSHSRVTSSATASYSPVPKPQELLVPSFITLDMQLHTRMLASLHTYLESAPTRHHPPSDNLKNCFGVIGSLLSGFSLQGEGTTRDLFYKLWPPIQFAVQEVDDNTSLPQIDSQATIFSQIPDGLLSPYAEQPPQLHLKFKSKSAFSRYAHQIVAMGQGVTPLELGNCEIGARAIIFKVRISNTLTIQLEIPNLLVILVQIGVSMISREPRIPYALLFGGESYMLFSLKSSGEHTGLICSPIIPLHDLDVHFMSLVTFCLLRRHGLPLLSADVRVPAIKAPKILSQTRSSTHQHQANQHEKQRGNTHDTGSGLCSHRHLFALSSESLSRVKFCI
jgi:hypothetical protein